MKGTPEYTGSVQKDSKTERAKKKQEKQEKNTNKDPTTAHNLMFSEL